ARLAWSGGDEVYRAGQRDIATLYEYWVYLQLAGIVAKLSGVKLDYGSLVKVSREGLTVDLRKGRQHVVRGTLERLGRKLKLEFWFNRTFSAGVASGSWTRAMRPDFSLRITPQEEGAAYAGTWIHFDAKYRVDTVAQLFGVVEGIEPGAVNEADESDVFGDAEDTRTGRPLRADLLKMHAYKDAIRRS